MKHILEIELSEEEFRSVQDIAAGRGSSPTVVALEAVRDLARTFPPAKDLSEAERAKAMERLLRFAGVIDSGDPRSADNDKIDADLAKEYSRGLKPK